MDCSHRHSRRSSQGQTSPLGSYRLPGARTVLGVLLCFKKIDNTRILRLRVKNWLVQTTRARGFDGYGRDLHQVSVKISRMRVRWGSNTSILWGPCPPSIFLLSQQGFTLLEVRVALYVLSQRSVAVSRWTGIHQTNPDSLQAIEGMYSTNNSPLWNYRHHFLGNTLRGAFNCAEAPPRKEHL